MITNLYGNNSNIIAFKQNNAKKNNKKVAQKNIDTASFHQNGFSLLPLSKVRTYKKPELALTQMVKNGGTSHIKFSQEVKTLNSALKMEQPLLFKDNPNWELVKKMPETFSNFEINEVMTIIPYSIGKFHNDRINPIKQQRYYSEYDSRDIFKKYRECYQNYKIENEKDKMIAKVDEQAVTNRKQFFASYIKERSKYIDNNNQLDTLRQNLLKDENPSEDVVDAELLRMDIVTNQAGAFLTSEDGLEQNLSCNNKETSLSFLFNSYFSAKMLSEFKPQKKEENLSENEKKYFEEINKYAAYEREKIKQRIKAYCNELTSDKKTEKKYTETYVSSKDKRNLFFLHYLLNNPISNYNYNFNTNNVYSKTTLIDIVSDNLQQEYINKFYAKKNKISIKHTLCSNISDLYELICELIKYKMQEKNTENKAENDEYKKLKEKIKETEDDIKEQKQDIQNNLEYLLDDVDIT